MGQFLPVLALVVLGGLFAGVSSLMGRLLNPPQPHPRKNAPYECGIVDRTDSPDRFPVKFYLVAMIFIVFDIEVIFIYPFTQVFGELGGFGLVDILIFSGTLFIPFLFLVSNGALDWGPIKRRVTSDVRVGAHRTTTSTIRRVGTEGRPAVADAPIPRPDAEAA
ncbi:MAG: NADH-quinone oxidoreductase subunit A [Microthrixaceae bacterium]